MAKVLCVDDDASVARLVGDVVAFCGHTPEVITDSMAAVNALYDPAVRAVLADFMMPRLNGIELLTIVQDRDVTIRRVLITAAPTEADVLQAARSGIAQMVIGKPPGIADIRLALAWL